MTFEEAKRKYVHRFTMDYVPEWAQRARPDGKYYAPQYRSDEEWYANTQFPPHPLCYMGDCHSNSQTWPLGEALTKPYTKR